MMISIKRFDSINSLIRYLKSEIGNSTRYLMMIKQNWESLLGTESDRQLSVEVSERIRFVMDGQEVYSLRIIYKPGSNTMNSVINEAVSYLQHKSMILNAIIERLEPLSDEDKGVPVIALLLDSIPIMIITINNINTDRLRQ
ncbi:hypothetical protein [Vulcanisaeta thermophila]|uniref:hypothetical protein n=1 Tax=Vulcanisaeta thermophila TaxID=867917 RepID=UPI000853A91B|nr:hypothetical protein [Vulcanisaeta thermophila]